MPSRSNKSSSGTIQNPFPPPDAANEDGVVAVGGEPWPELLKIAYPQGIFPWPHEGLPLLWFSPDPRFVLDIHAAHLPRSLQKSLRKSPYRITLDTAFSDVMLGCQAAYRPGQAGTWITDAMRKGYGQLHHEGLAHSVEAWHNEELVGGLYGVSFGKVFFGESMFAKAPDASKIAFATLLANLAKWGFQLVDCQSYTDHLARFGASEWPRERFLRELRLHVEETTKLGPWEIEVPPAEVKSVLQSRQEKA